MRSIRALSSCLLVLAAAGCQDPPAPPIDAAHPDDLTPRRGGTMRLASFADIRTLDPAVTSDALAAEALELMFAGLVDFDAQGKVAPDLAGRFEVSPDGTVYRFVLRPGLVFHDGSPLTAADVKRSIERSLAPDTPNSFASFYDRIAGFDDFTTGKAPHLDGVTVGGRFVVSIRLREPDATFLSALAMHSLRPVCPSAGDKYDPTWLPCGAGPFKLVAGNWDRGRSLLLLRHDGYHRPGEPYLDAVQWSYGMNGVTQRFKLEAGDLDGTRELSLADTARFRRDPRWKSLGDYDSARSIWAEGMNVEMPPFDNVEVRRAVANALDRDQYRLLRAANLEALTRVLSRSFRDEDPAFPGQKHDLAAALEHMARAGLPYDPTTGQGGYPKTIIYVVYKQGLIELTGQLLQQQLARIGLRIELKVVSYSTYLSLTKRRGTTAMAPEGWQQDFPDASDFFDPLFASSAINDEDSNNTSFYRNPVLDELLVRGRKELDPATRKRMYDEADAMVCADAPWALTYAYRSWTLHQPYVRGFVPHPVWSEYVAKSWLDRASSAVASRSGVLRDVRYAAGGAPP
ncbi:MAG TPA: ABC transporter substrate-binding protein [Polyangiaceae bacterium]